MLELFMAVQLFWQERQINDSKNLQWGFWMYFQISVLAPVASVSNVTLIKAFLNLINP